MKIIFEANGETFGAINKARSLLRKHGFSVGSMCNVMPIGIYYGNAIIGKWRNLSEYDKESLHGKITSKDWREGSVEVEINRYNRRYLRDYKCKN
jgi:hypothetical protein